MAGKRPRRTPWRTTWTFATSNGLLVVLLMAIAAGLLVSTWLPQAPLDDPAAYARWLSNTQAQFSDATPILRAMGAFNVTHSVGFRLLLALLGGCLVLRLIDGAQSLSQPPTLAQSAPLTAHAGGLVVLIGLVIANLYGWRVEDVVLQGGERQAIAGHDAWVAAGADSQSIAHSPGIGVRIQERGPGLRLNAFDETGKPLLLKASTEAPATETLSFALTEDRYLAIPAAQLIVQLSPDEDADVIARIYGSPSGELVAEEPISTGTEIDVAATTIAFERAPYMMVDVVANPGRWPIGLGVLLGMLGLIGDGLLRYVGPTGEEEEAPGEGEEGETE